MICYKSMCDLHHKRDCIFLMHGPYLVPMFSTVFFFFSKLWRVWYHKNKLKLSDRPLQTTLNISDFKINWKIMSGLEIRGIKL